MPTTGNADLGGDVRTSSDQMVLCLNSGSSSLKLALYQIGHDAEEVRARGAVEGIGQPQGHLWLVDANRQSIADQRTRFVDHEASIKAALQALETAQLPPIDAIGHRIVQGGIDHAKPERVNTELMEKLRALVPLAPLHLPSEIAAMESTAAHYPSIPQVACFDTAFHRGMPEIAQRYALPRQFWNDGVRRYGFHGISYEYILARLGAAPAERIIVAHLGNGASMAAVRGGRPLDTTMGFTPTGGLMMGTRSGDLDPGLLLYLLNEKHLSADQLSTMVNQESGLLGVSGTSSDMKTLLEARSSDPRATEAVEMFCYSARKHIGALAAVLGGLDTLVFTGGIGERAAPVREMICRGLEYLGIVIDSARNASNADTISAVDTGCVVRVIPTDEDLMIARHTRNLLFGSAQDQNRNQQ